ncbi:hypothetical protein [Streptomyces sp. NPDC001348]
MRRRLLKPLLPLLWLLVLAGTSAAAWAAWLGWDQKYDEHPDGTVSGPYQAWQVIGLVLTLLAPVCWAAYRRHFAGTVLGTTLGLTVAANYDWSDDSTGQYGVGVVLIMMGSLAATAVVSAVAASMARDVQRIGA